MDLTLNKLTWKNCLVYLDEVIVFSSSYEQNKKDVKNILTVLQSVGVTLNLKKISF